MRKITLTFVFTFVFLALSSQASSGETFAPVDMYISSGSNGQLKIQEPSGSSVESITIADGETGQGTFQELGRWTSPSLKTDFNISGDWTGQAWIRSDNRDATVNIRYTLIQNEQNIEQFEFGGDVDYGETVQLVGTDDFSLSSLDDSPVTLVIESSWSGRGAPPPPTEGNTSIIFEYGASSRDTLVTLPISHLQIFRGSDPTGVTGQNEFHVYVNVYDVFGVDGVLSLDTGDYSMSMGPEGDSPWSASTDKVSKKSDYVEVKFLWSYEGRNLPAGENFYNIEVDARDLLSDLDWSKSLQTLIYIEPIPDLEINPVTSTSKTTEFDKAALYTLSVENTGSGTDEFIVTYDNNDGWDISIDTTDVILDPGDKQNIKVSVTPPDTASNGQESPTQVTITAASDSDISESITLITTATEPQPNWDFTLNIDKEGSEAYDYSSDSFVIKDRAAIEVFFTVKNEGNDQNNFNLKSISADNAFSSSFSPSIISSLSPGQTDSGVLTLTPREDYDGTNTFIEIEVTSAADGGIERLAIEIYLEQSGSILATSSPQVKVSAGKTLTHVLTISNADVNAAKRVYFGVSGDESNDKLAESWFTFSDKNGNVIAYGSFLTLLPAQQVEITVKISIPSSADIGSYYMGISMYNEFNAKISNVHSLQLVATEVEATEESNTILYTALFFAFASALVYGYRNFYLDDSYDDEYDDFDELEDMPEIFEEFSSVPEEPDIMPIPQPSAPMLEQADPAPIAENPVNIVSAPLETLESETATNPKKKWFGLFGKATEPVVAAPVAAEPVVAEPIVGQIVNAEPVKKTEE